MTARDDAMQQLMKSGYTRNEAEAVMTRLDRVPPPQPRVGTNPDEAAWLRAMDRLIRIHRTEYRRLLAQERGYIPGSAEIDDNEFPLPGDEPPDEPDEE